MSEPKVPVVAVKSYRGDAVGLRIKLRCHGSLGGSAADITAGAELTVKQARDLAASLICLADAADGRAATKAAAEARRQKWRDREVSAGRMFRL